MGNGSIEIIVGGMYSGKTEELLRRVKRARYANLEVVVFKPKIDNRYSDELVVSHCGNDTKSFPIESSDEIEKIIEMESSIRVKPVVIVAIDEVQFLDRGVVKVCERLANKGYRVILSGLDMDYMGEPFIPVPDLMAISDSVTKLKAVCMSCGSDAMFSYRKSGLEGIIKVGGAESYEARCRTCFMKFR